MKKSVNIILILFSVLFLFLPLKTYAIDVSNLYVTQNNGTLTVKNVEGVDSSKNTRDYQDTYMTNRYNKYITVISFITAIATITMAGIFIKHIIHFASLGTEHWIVRRNAMIGLLWSGIATALLGSTTLILAIVYNAFQL